MKKAAVIGISAALFVTTSFPCSIFAIENTQENMQTTEEMTEDTACSAWESDRW